MKGKLLSVLFAVLLLIVAFSGCFEEKESDLEKKDTMPDIFAVCFDGITRLSYNTSINQYDISISKNFVNTGDKSSIVYLNDTFFMVLNESLISLNKNLEIENQLDLGTIGALAVSDNTIFVAYNGSLFAFDKNLKELSSIYLNVTIRGEIKNAHNIIIYEKRAYLLDNIVFPIYVFIIDIKDVDNLQINKTIEVWGMNQHLNDHWLNPELNQWLIVQSWGGRGGSGQGVLIYSLSNGTKIKTESIYFDGRGVSYGNGTWNGTYAVTLVTDFSPAWAIVSNNSSSYYVAKISSFDNCINFSDFVDLNITLYSGYGYSGEFFIKEFGNYLFITYGKQLRAIDISQKPSLILSQNIDGIDYIRDFVLTT